MTNDMAVFSSWAVAGSYYEVCNCEAICPCRRSDGAKSGRPTYETCDFALSWWIKQGHAGEIALAGLKVVMAGRWETTPGNPWHVTLYVDEAATPDQHDALTAVFLGRAGGGPQKGYAGNIVEVHAVKTAAIDLDHSRARETIEVAPYLLVRTREAVPHAFTVSCGIPATTTPARRCSPKSSVIRMLPTIGSSAASAASRRTSRTPPEDCVRRRCAQPAAHRLRFLRLEASSAQRALARGDHPSPQSQPRSPLDLPSAQGIQISVG
jgi:hypothetical protein